MKSRAPSGRGLDEQRRLDLDEAGLVVRLADRLDEASAGEDALLERLPAQVEVAVREAHRLVDLGVGIVDDEGRRARRPEHRRSDRRAPRRRRSRGAGFSRARQPLDDGAVDLDDELAADVGCRPRGRPERSVASTTTWVMP